MTNNKIDVLIPVHCTYMPDVLLPGHIYISLEFETAIHLCACGCGGKTVTPFNRDGHGWTLTEVGDKVTLTPSIGNWSGENPYHAHYFVTGGKIVWC